MMTIEQHVRTIYALLKETYENWRADRAIRMGAGLAYYAVFAAVPLLTSAMAIASAIFSAAEIEEFLIESLEALFATVSPEARSLIDTLAESIDRPSVSGGLATISVFVGIFAASLLFVALQDALNMIWDIPFESGFRYSIRRRVIAFGVVLLVGVALIASLAVQTVALVVDEVFGGTIGEVLHLNDLLVSLATWAVGVGAIAVLFRLLIPEHLGWRNTLIAASLIAVLMVLGTWAVGVYFRNWGSASLTGVSGGLVVGLTWLYYLAQIVVAGAELLKTLEERTAPATES